MSRRSYAVDEIRLAKDHSVSWRFIDHMRQWEIIALDNRVDGEQFRSVSGKTIIRRLKQGPGTDEFSQALGEAVTEAVLSLEAKGHNP